MDVVALGELLIDFTCVGTDADGYPTMAAHPGGAPANFLAALTKFGAKTALLGKVAPTPSAGSSPAPSGPRGSRPGAWWPRTTCSQPWPS